jgi:DNA invertase Pin-like site-specific DNA recombinase
MSARGNTEAAVYLRVSLDRAGDHLAVDRQREDCLKIIADRGWNTFREYVDNSVSASDKRKDRPAYNDMVADFDAGRFNALVCWDLDRLTRQPRQLEDWIDAAQDRGLKLVTANGEADLSTDGGRLFARIKASVARAEVERKGARQARAAQQRSSNGRPPLGVRLTGYTPKGELVEEEAAVVGAIFDRFTRGESIRGLVRWLDESGTPTRNGTPWHPTTVYGILRNPRYAGLAVYRGELTGQRGNWPAIVSEDAWRAVQARLSDPRRTTNKQGTDRKYIGSGIYLCGLCGKPVNSWSAARYRCRQCRVGRSMGPVDEFVLMHVRARLADPGILAAMVEHRDTAELDERAAALRARLDAIAGDYDAGLIDGLRYASARQRVEAELEQLDGERAKFLDAPAIAGTLSAPDPVAAFEAESLMIRRAVIDALVKVTLFPGRKGSRAFDPATVIVEPKGAGS